MEKSIEIRKLVIRIGKKELELSPAEAKELKEMLGELLGNKETIYIPGMPYIAPYPTCPTYPTYPRWVYWTDTNTAGDGLNTYTISCNSSN